MFKKRKEWLVGCGSRAFTTAKRGDYFHLIPIKIVLLVITLLTSGVAADDYPLALEDPIVDGAFTTDNEYRGALKHLDDLEVGYFYKQYVEDWTVGSITYNDTITFFDLHYFFHPGYGQLDDYDLNSFGFKYGEDFVTTWVFLSGNNPDENDHLWLDMVGIGTANYPNGINDDGGFLVRLNNDPNTDKIWRPGDPQPGDLTWNFADFYGVFAHGGFNRSAYTQGYDSTHTMDPREIYEWSITLSTVTGIPGVDDSIPPAEPCDPIWIERTKWKWVKDWTPEMGGFGEIGGPGWIPDGTEWIEFDMSWLHPVPPQPPGNPAVSEWGLIIMTVLMLTVGVVVIAQRRRPTAV